MQCTVKWGYGNEPHFASSKAFIKALKETYPHVPGGDLEFLVNDAERQDDSWAPHTLWGTIKKHIAQNYVAPSTTILSGSIPQIPHEDLRNYWDSTFKTMLYAVIDGQCVAEEKSETNVGHAEEKLLKQLDKWISSKGWQIIDIAEHELTIYINNSCCVNCSWNIYHWEGREFFHTVKIYFANIYQEQTDFTPSTLLLRGGGVDVQPISVTSTLLPRATGKKDERFREDNRKQKDLEVNSKFQKWAKENTSSSMKLFPDLHVSPNQLGKKQTLEQFQVHSYK